jgi:hypothetical protein
LSFRVYRVGGRQQECFVKEGVKHFKKAVFSLATVLGVKGFRLGDVKQQRIFVRPFFEQRVLKRVYLPEKRLEFKASTKQFKSS